MSRTIDLDVSSKAITKVEIEDMFAIIVNVPCLFYEKRVIIRRVNVDDEKKKVAIYYAFGGKPAIYNFNEMKSFFHHCKPITEEGGANSNGMPQREAEQEEEEEEEEEDQSDMESEEDSSALNLEIGDHLIDDSDLNEFDPVPKKTILNRSSSMKGGLLFTSEKDIGCTVSDLKNILMKTIDKVRDDKDYIPQANAINQSVNTIINLAKLSLQIIAKKNGHKSERE